MTWNPNMDEAPRDGTHFLAYEDGDIYRACWANGGEYRDFRLFCKGKSKSHLAVSCRFTRNDARTCNSVGGKLGEIAAC